MSFTTVGQWDMPIYIYSLMVQLRKISDPHPHLLSGRRPPKIFKRHKQGERTKKKERAIRNEHDWDSSGKKGREGSATIP